MPQSRHNVQYVETSDDVVCLVQLTDTHLCQARGGTLLGMDTDHSLQAVIDLVKKERPQLHLLLGTGDLSDGGARSAYDRLQVYFDQLSPDNYWLPGNHDRRDAMLAAASSPDRLCKEIRVARWQVLLLDSQVPGQVGGALGDDELALLERALQAAQEQGLYTLVCLHHQPVTIGCGWLDEQMVADAEAFFAVLDQYSGVRAVLWGHVHQEIDRKRNGVRLLASPSTCVQFAAGCENFKADDQPPGYRWLELHNDGRVETAVSRVRDVHFEVELDSGGYL
ncbi:MAG: 3',5'-cyclic-AMP phosphodiesterase [Halioglobus sp.]|nr:3',5'-cyclic-AMP phosphodiesterase [Halioglobus sp.]